MGSGAFCCPKKGDFTMSIFLTIYLCYLVYKFVCKNV